MKKVEMVEEHELKWPDGLERTRIQERKLNKAALLNKNGDKFSLKEL